jgi:hypothetical protein
MKCRSDFRPLFALLPAIIFALPIFVFPTFARAQAQQAQDPLAPSSNKVKRHVEEIMRKEKGAESRGKKIAEKAKRDALAETYRGLGGRQEKGAKKHPWLKSQPEGVNPRWDQDYTEDSLLLQSVLPDDGPALNTASVWSCFEPQLVAQGCWRDNAQWAMWNRQYVAMEPDLAALCAISCPPIPFTTSWRENCWQVVQYWWPEYQVAINNYGLNRVNPRTLTPETGQQFLLQQLLARKKQIPEPRMKRDLERDYKLSLAKFKEPNRDKPRFGQGMWGGYAQPDFEDKQFGHIYRTKLSAQTSDAKKNTRWGWLWDSDSIFDAFPPKTREKHRYSLSTEWGLFEAFTVWPRYSYELPGTRHMEALHGQWGNLSQRAKDDKNPFWKTKGAMAYRIQRWPDPFNPLQKILKLSPDQNELLKEAVYKGGQELYPFTTNISGFTEPNLASGAIMARRTFLLAGMEAITRFLPAGERSRIPTYTVDRSDKSREIDKYQLIWPRLSQGRTAECMRSQKVPNMVDQTQDPWVKKNLPHDLQGYVDDHFGEQVYVYWNKRVACSCRDRGIGRGSWTMNVGPKGRGDGDQTYGRFENNRCTWLEGTLPSAFAGQDSRSCTEVQNPPNKYRGIDDRV